MPYQKRSQRRNPYYYKRNRYRRRRKRKNKKSKIEMRVISHPSQIMPDMIKMPMTASLSSSTIFGAVSTANAQFTANNLKDPFGVLGNPQPLGYDQMFSFYNRYRVHACKISVKVINVDASPTSLQLAIAPTTSSTAPTTFDQVAEQPYSTSLMVGYSNDTGELKNYISTAKIFGEKVLDRNYSSSGGGPPTSLWYWNLFGKTGDGGTLLEEMIVTLTFYVEWFERKQLASSSD